MVKKKQKKIKKSRRVNFLFKPRRIKIKVIGIGGGGSSIVSEIAKSISNASFVVVDSDHRVIKKAGKGVKVIQLGRELTNDWGLEWMPDLGRK